MTGHRSRLGAAVALSMLLAGSGVATSQEPLGTVDVGVEKWAQWAEDPEHTAARTVDVGDTVTYTVHLDRLGLTTGPDEWEARGVVLTDVLPRNADFVEGSLRVNQWDSGSLAYDPDREVITGTWDRVRFDAYLTYDVRVTAPGPLVNEASVRTTGTRDPNPANDSATVQLWTRYPSYEARATKTPSVSEAVIGDRITYRVTWENTGPGMAYGVRLVDRLPVGAAFVRDSLPPFCFPNAGRSEVECFLGDVGPGSRWEFSYTIEVTGYPPEGTLTNRLSTSSDDPIDRDMWPATAGVTIATPLADLALVKEADRTSVAAGDRVRYRLTIRNQGLDTAYRVRLADAVPIGGRIDPSGLPAECILTYADPYDRTSPVLGFSWFLGDLGPGETRTMTYEVVAGGSEIVVNRARLSTESDDADPANDGSLSSTPVTPTATAAPGPTDSRACVRCLEKYRDACRLVCRADGSTKPNAGNMTCQECIQSLRKHECAKECLASP